MKYSQDDAEKLQVVLGHLDTKQTKSAVVMALSLLRMISFEDLPGSEMYFLNGSEKRNVIVSEFLEQQRQQVRGRLSLTLDVKIPETVFVQLDELVDAELGDDRSKVVRLAINVLHRLIVESTLGWSLVRTRKGKPSVLFRGLSPVSISVNDEEEPNTGKMSPLPTSPQNLLRDFELRRQQIMDLSQTDSTRANDLLLATWDKNPLTEREHMQLREILAPSRGPQFSCAVPDELAHVLFKSPLALTDPKVVRVYRQPDSTLQQEHRRASILRFNLNRSIRIPQAWCSMLNLSQRDPLAQLLTQS